MGKSKSLELIVGLVVVTGLVILAYLITQIGEFRREPRYQLRIIFGFVSGITEASPVSYSGVDAGNVQSVRTFFDKEENRPKVEVMISIRKGLKVQEDAKAYIATLGFLGEKYIDILPGTPGARILKEGEVLVGYDPLLLELRMAETGRETLDKLDQTVEALNNIIGDKENQAHFAQILANLEELTGRLSYISADLRSLIGENKDNITASIENIKTVSENMDVTLNSVNAILAKLEKGEGTLGKFLQDEELYNDLKEWADDIKRNPWKLLRKTREKKPEREDKKNSGDLKTDDSPSQTRRRIHFP